MIFSYEEKYKEITLVVPKEKFGKLPEKITYKSIPYGRMEKAWRLLIRSIMSAIDNGKNAEKYGKLKKQYWDKRNSQNKFKSELSLLRHNLETLGISIKKYGLKIEGCSNIKEQIKETEKRIKEIEEEMKTIKQQIPTYMWESICWW